MNWLIQKLAEAISALIIPAIEKAIGAEFDRLTNNAATAIEDLIPGHVEDGVIGAGIKSVQDFLHRVLGR